MTDVVWLVLDSLSQSLTPFADDGPDTMPNFERVAREEGIVYTDAYVPGLFSAPSHGSFFTGYLPSKTGVHRINPQFPGNHPTIAEMLSDTHESFIITDNPFVHNGLARTFENNHRIPVSNWEIFDAEGTSINSFLNNTDRDGAGKYAEFVLEGGKPVRSLANGISYKVRQAVANAGNGPSRAALGSWGPYVSKKIESYVFDRKHDVLAVANYMDPHPPFDPSEEALDRFLPDIPRSQLPTNVSGDELQSYDIKKRIGLAKAATWDLDKHVGPLVERLVEKGAFVAVTADHGHGFHRSRRFEKERMHVPLILFPPDEHTGQVNHTVNIIDLPATTMDCLQTEARRCPGESLLDVTADRISITESIRSDSETTNGIDLDKPRDREIVYDIAGVSGEGWVEYIDEEFVVKCGDGIHTQSIKERIQELIDTANVAGTRNRAEYDAETMQRLKDFGYL
jgi:hypothetical protein